MRQTRLISLCAGLLALAAGGLTGGCARERKTEVLTDVPYEIQPWQYGREPGHVVKTEHYLIYTTLDDFLLLESLPQAMEMLYRHYRELVPPAREPQEPMPIYFFAQREQFERFTRQLAGPRARKLLQIRQGGYSERGVSVIEYVSHGATFPLVGHEGFHQYVYHCLPGRIPAWLNEGLAVLCEGQRWGKAGLSEFDPWHNPRRRNSLADAVVREETFPLAELLATNAGEVVGGPARRLATYYAQLWALMLFLQEGQDGKYAAGLHQLCDALGSGQLELIAEAAQVRAGERPSSFGEALFAQFISDDLETVEREYLDFVHARILGGRR